ncbi:MAG: SET domain-containing protein [DPANN group archaeon]|nr:SET domain-containing protein [DPANN group archaeon]
MAKNRWIEIRDSNIHGSGIYAARDTPQGTRIIRYVGRLITKKEAERLAEKEEKAGTVYIFELDGRHDIDGNIPENTARLINHSCTPNCESVQYGREIWIEAMRDIKTGEELTYDYCFDEEEKEHHVCRCGSANCRGFIVKGKD